MSYAALTCKLSTFAAVVLTTAVMAAPAVKTIGNRWVEAYQSSPAEYEMKLPEDMQTAPQFVEWLRPTPPLTGTIRTRFAVSAAGDQIRIRFSNEERDQPLAITAASVGLAANEFDAQAGSLQPLTFGGARSIVVPAGAPVLSDPVAMPIAVLAELVVSMQAESGVQLQSAGGTAIAVAEGNQTLADKFKNAKVLSGRSMVTGAAVRSGKSARVIVAFGDSITDGNRMKIGELRGWPEQLQRRIVQRKEGPALSIVNAAIGGNRVLTSSLGKAGLARFDRDVARIEGVSHVVVLEGINDLGFSGKTLLGDNPPVSASELITGYRQIIARAHLRGIKVIMATLLPFEGAMYFSAYKEEQRRALNDWIRSSGEADGVIDFEAVMRDPANPSKLKADYDSGDHLHPSEAGYKAMGDAVDLKLFE